jgi:hypothetical protein
MKYQLGGFLFVGLVAVGIYIASLRWAWLQAVVGGSPAVFLNRLGIFFAFVAGFLTTPDLVGIDRLDALEKRTERTMGEAKQRLAAIGKEVIGKNREVVVQDFLFSLFVTLAIVGCVGAIVFLTFRRVWIWIAAVVGLAYLTLIIVALDRRLWIPVDPTPTGSQAIDEMREMFRRAGVQYVQPITRREKIKLRTWRIITVDPLETLVVLILLAIPGLVMFFTIFPLHEAARFISSKLEGEKRFQSIFMWWGLVFYVLGNFVQLTATYLAR